MLLEHVRDEGNYLRFNVNCGDSCGYYVDKRTPHIVWNFKGEDPFLLDVADPQTYPALLQNCADHIGRTDSGHKPFAFRDMRTDTYYHGFMNPTRSAIAWIEHAKPHSIKDFYADFGYAMPQCHYIFAPHDDRQIDLNDRFINRYNQPRLFARVVDIPKHYRGAELGGAAQVKDLCPTLYKIIHSIVGSDDEEFEYFFNWTAFIIKHKTRALTSYILHGTQGTGKGVFF